MRISSGVCENRGSFRGGIPQWTENDACGLRVCPLDDQNGSPWPGEDSTLPSRHPRCVYNNQHQRDTIGARRDIQPAG